MGLFGSNTNKLKCKKCGTVLSDHDRLKKHQEKAHNKKKEKCRACGAEFDYPDAALEAEIIIKESLESIRNSF